MITIRVKGIEYSTFETATGTKQLDAASGSFSFQAVETKYLSIPIKINDACSVYADGVKIIDGFIESVSGSCSSNTHSITISGRDKTCDFIDSTIDVLTLNAPISLKRAIETIIAQIGSSVSVIQDVQIEDFQTSEDLVSASLGENAFAFASKLARKKQVLISVNGDGNILLTRSPTAVSPIKILNRINGNDNNVISSSWNFDNSQRFSRYKALSQLNMVASRFSGVQSSLGLTDQQAKVVTDNAIRGSRQLIFQAENLSGVEAATARTEWEANIRQTRGKVYSCTVDSFSINETFLKPNLLCQVIDDFAKINDIMLLNSVQYSSNPGTEALLSFVPRNAYQVALEEPQEVGNNYFA